MTAPSINYRPSSASGHEKYNFVREDEANMRGSTDSQQFKQ